MGDKKDYDKKVRKVNNGEKAEKKIGAIHKMVESLIASDSDAAAEHLHNYLQEKTRDLILGEKKGEMPDFIKDKMKDKDDDDSDDSDDDKKDSKEKDDDKDDKKDEKKEDVKEGVAPKSNLTGAKGPKFASENANKGKVSGNSLRDKPHKSNDTKAKGPEFKENADKGKIAGNSLKKKPHKENLTGAKGPEFSKENANKGKVAHYDDGRDRSMGTTD